MAQKGQRIYGPCRECHGTGIMYIRDGITDGNTTNHPQPGHNYTEVECTECDEGMVMWGWLRDDKEDTMPGEGL